MGNAPHQADKFPQTCPRVACAELSPSTAVYCWRCGAFLGVRDAPPALDILAKPNT